MRSLPGSDSGVGVCPLPLRLPCDRGASAVLSERLRALDYHARTRLRSGYRRMSARFCRSGPKRVQVLQGVEPQEVLAKWTEDGRALLMYSSTPLQARISRVDKATGKRTLLQTVEPREKAGSILPMRLAYAEGSKTYVYSTVQILGTLYVAEGLE